MTNDERNPNDEARMTKAEGDVHSGFVIRHSSFFRHRSLVIRHFAAPAALWLVGMLLAFYPVLFSGFTHVSGDLGDARLLNYLLEHGYRWLLRRPAHHDLWSPPFFYPERNVGAYSDILLSAGPCYWPWRLLGCSPESAFQLCLMMLVTLNYLSFYLLAARCLRLPSLPAAFGAFLFAFASPRLVHMVHLQLHVHFYTVACVYALCRRLGDGPSLLGKRVWIAVFFLGIVGQFYGSFYLGWFLGMGLLVSLLWALPSADFRARLGRLLREYPWSVVFWGLLAALALADLGWHYLRAARSAGYHDPDLLRWGIPYLTSWWSRGRESWFNLTNGLVALGVLKFNPWPVGEHALGLGPFTYALVFVGLWQLRRCRPVRVLLGAALTLFVCVSAVAPGVSLWQHLAPYLPAGSALRAVCRLGLLLLIPAALCAAWAMKGLSERRPWLALVLVLLCVLEQGRTLSAFDREEHRRRVAEVAVQISPGSRAFLAVPEEPLESDVYSCRLHIDAMWASLETTIPTVNGYSGKMPLGWTFEEIVLRGPTDGRHVEGLLRRWLDRFSIGGKVVRSPAGTGPVRVFLVTDP